MNFTTETPRHEILVVSVPPRLRGELFLLLRNLPQLMRLLELLR